ncbi:mRNA splicing protein prp18 [Coelomomyces lativittatus]|nr:mRNA splicing protein prp18 [Coelomomyces lativittatus]
MENLKSLINQVKLKEFEKKRKIIDLDPTSDSDTSKKYIRRKDLQKVQELEYCEQQLRLKQKAALQNQQTLENNTPHSLDGSGDDLTVHSSSPNLSSKKPSSSQISSNLRSTLTSLSPNGGLPSTSTSQDRELPAEDVIRGLRLRGHPIRLFGETDAQRIVRLHHLEASVEEGQGQRNEYAKQLAKTEAGLALAFFQKSTNGEEIKKFKTIYKPDYDVSLLQGPLFEVNPDLTFILVYIYLRRLLDVWENELDDRPDSVKRSNVGKHEYTKFVQTKENLKPFFKLLKRKAVENDVMEKIAEILGYVQQREYIKAYDAYLQLSIGNAPWPIGVTMVVPT